MVSIRTLAAAAAFLAPALAAGLTPAELVSSIKALTQKADGIKAVNVQDVTDTAGTLLGSVTHFNGAISQLTQKVTEMTPIPAGADADNVFNAYHQLVAASAPAAVSTVHDTVDTLLAGALGLRDVGDVVADTVSNTLGPLLPSALRVTHTNIDGLSGAMIPIVNSRATDIQSETDNLLATIDEVLKAATGAAGVAN